MDFRLYFQQEKTVEIKARDGISYDDSLYDYVKVKCMDGKLSYELTSDYYVDDDKPIREMVEAVKSALDRMLEMKRKNALQEKIDLNEKKV